MIRNIIIFGFFLLLTSCNSSITQEPDCEYSKMEKVENYKELKLNLSIAFDDFGGLNKCSKEYEKPILTIYGGYNSMGYPKAQWRPMADENINQILRTEFLIRYYHVDNKLPLPDTMITSSSKTIGEYFAKKQIDNYGVMTQPFYTITNWKEEDMVKPIHYVSKKEFDKFENFLLEGIKAYTAKK